ncbi:cell division cycle 5-related protein-like [Convolutriloba macropyga]|uniref:cell division cycle 5-related protein-like n=1 Tax=Convolutriloba macropyga TaxID=536237 RepID=UPI003F51BB45
MTRITIKGGVWRNTEDEILKAAVMKYGLNQWSRIASLLHRKSAKQCKSRWYEWLDPSIKKTEWSRQEDEKLLHLAKLMPTQWRTIAPIVGRTAAQCLERYEYLLDQAQKKGEDGHDARKLKPGEIDPNPETKPAKPDPIDMDEDELEMLSEARARLANTQGKKAKRKAREKQLEEARRLASLQKKRELRAAGIKPREFNRRKRGVDYNVEIPFEKKPAPGFFDTAEEHVAHKEFDFHRLRQNALDGETRDEVEAKERRKDRAKMKQLKEDDLPAAILKTHGSVMPEKKRSKLVLPQPQVTDKELEQVVKMGQVSQLLKEEMGSMAGSEGGATPSSVLLDNYQIQARPGLPTRTPKTPAQQNTVMEEARNLLAMSQQETPLLGGENTMIMGGTGFSGMTPKTQVVATPNTVMATPFMGGSATPANAITDGNFSVRSARGSVGPVIPASVRSTPLRDNLNINDLTGGAFNEDEDSVMGDNDDTRSMISSASSVNHALLKQQLKSDLSNLPQPKNDFEIVLPEEGNSGQQSSNRDDDAMEVEGGLSSSGLNLNQVPDAADLEECERLVQEEERKRMLYLASIPVQRDLPRPFEINTSILRPSNIEPPLTDLQKAEELIKKEMLVMQHFDCANFAPEVTVSRMPEVKKAKLATSTNAAVAYLNANPFTEFSDRELSQAHNMLKSEMELVKDGMGHGNLPLDIYSQVWAECYEKILFVPSQNRYTHGKYLSKKERLEYLEKRLEQNRAHMARDAKKASKYEKKLKILLGGYQSRSIGLTKQLNEIHEQIQQSQTELNSFKELQAIESAAIPRRMQTISEDLGRQKERESTLQQKYSDLTLQKDLLTSKLTVFTKKPDTQLTVDVAATTDVPQII